MDALAAQDEHRADDSPATLESPIQFLKVVAAGCETKFFAGIAWPWKGSGY
jgi:hypothetical protein